MRKLVALVLSALACAIASPVPAAASGARVVYPTGLAASDVPQVQAAVNAGGSILLKASDANGVPAAFEFGSGSVRLNNDVAISGETVNRSMTTVRHGRFPFRTNFSHPVHSSFSGIHFDSPRSTAVFVGTSTGFSFTDNLITDVVGLPAFGLLKGQAVWVTDSGFKNHITGTITIANNVVERVHADLSYGVALASFDADATITGNTFIDTKDTGVLVVYNSKPVVIEGNSIAGGAPEQGFTSVGNGILVGQGTGAFTIRRNTVVSDNPLADGIALSGDLIPGHIPGSSLVEKNSVTMRGSQFGGITVYGEVQASLIANNHVDGDGAYALDITPIFGNEICDGTTFRGNNISGFNASVADVFLDVNAYNTVLRGHSGIVIDNGTNNRITGFTPMGGDRNHALDSTKDAMRQLELDTSGPSDDA